MHTSHVENHCLNRVRAQVHRPAFQSNKERFFINWIPFRMFWRGWKLSSFFWGKLVGSTNRKCFKSKLNRPCGITEAISGHPSNGRPLYTLLTGVLFSPHAINWPINPRSVSLPLSAHVTILLKNMYILLCSNGVCLHFLHLGSPAPCTFVASMHS